MKLFITILAKTIITYRKKFSYNRKIFYVGFKEGYLTSLLPILVNLKNIFVINLIRDPREIACSRNYSNNNRLSDFDTTKKHPIIMIALLCKNNMMIDMHMLSLCDFNIGPPSSFGTWISWYGNVPRMTVEKNYSISSSEQFSICEKC